MKAISAFNKRKTKHRSECRECQTLDNFNFLARKRYKDKLHQQYEADEKIVETKRRKRKKELNDVFKDVSVYDIENKQFIVIPLITTKDDYKGDPFLAIQAMKEKIRRIN